MDRDPYLPLHMQRENEVCPLCEERASMDRLDKAMDRLVAIGVVLLIAFWAVILLVLIGIAFDVPGNLFQAH